MISKRKIKTKVNSLLEELGINSPPINVEDIAKYLGITFKFIDFENDQISGLLVKKTNKVILAINHIHSDNRQRFTIAHELGHFLFHMNTPIFVDESPYFRNTRSSKGVDSEEIEANNFAAELLMPEKLITKSMEQIDVSNSNAISALAEQYNVSIEALVFRLLNLGYEVYI